MHAKTFFQEIFNIYKILGMDGKLQIVFEVVGNIISKND